MSEEQQFAEQKTTDFQQPDLNSIKTRLDPEAIISRYEANLRGGFWQTTETNGEIKDVFIKTRKKTLVIDEMCIDTVIRWLNNCVNPHTLQGNVNIDQLNIYMMILNQDLAKMFFDNAHVWKINGRTANMLINEIMKLAYLALTRTIDDKERQYWSQGVKVNERIGVQAQSVTSKNKLGGF